MYSIVLSLLTLSSWTYEILNDVIQNIAVRPDGAVVVSGANTYVLNSTSGSQIQMWTTSALLAIFGDSSMLLYFQSYGQFYIYKLNPSGKTAVVWI